MLERVIADYPDEVMMVANAHSALADSYLQDGGLSQAVEHLRLCLILEKGRHFEHRADLRLAEVLIACNPSEAELDEAAALLDEAGERVFSAAHAREALALLADNTPKLTRHPDVGLIRTDAETVNEMERLAGESGR